MEIDPSRNGAFTDCTGRDCPADLDVYSITPTQSTSQNRQHYRAALNIDGTSFEGLGTITVDTACPGTDLNNWAQRSSNRLLGRCSIRPTTRHRPSMPLLRSYVLASETIKIENATMATSAVGREENTSLYPHKSTRPLQRLSIRVVSPTAKKDTGHDQEAPLTERNPLSRMSDINDHSTPWNCSMPAMRTQMVPLSARSRASESCSTDSLEETSIFNAIISSSAATSASANVVSRVSQARALTTSLYSTGPWA